MRILYAHNILDPNHPAAQMVSSIARELESLGHEVQVHVSGASKSGSATVPAAGASVRKAPSRLGRAVWFAKETARDRAAYARDLAAVAEFRPNVVLARHDVYRSSTARAATQSNVPLVTYADAPVAYESRLYPLGGRWHPPLIAERIERRILQSSAAVVTVSRPAARILEKYRTGTPIEVVPNGVEPSRFPALSADERLAVRSRLGITRPVVGVFVGTFRPFHGLDLLGGILRETADQQDLQWLLVGDGPGRTALEADAPAGTVFAGRRPPAEIGEILAVCDIAVAPYPPANGEFYFCPLKVLEYAAAGCAVVASDRGDVSWLLDDGRCCLIAKSDSLQDWLKAVVELVEDPGRRRSLGDSARRFVLSDRTWSQTAAGVEDVLKTAVAARLPSSAAKPVVAYT